VRYNRGGVQFPLAGSGRLRGLPPKEVVGVLRRFAGSLASKHGEISWPSIASSAGQRRTGPPVSAKMSMGHRAGCRLCRREVRLQQGDDGSRTPPFENWSPCSRNCRRTRPLRTVIRQATGPSLSEVKITRVFSRDGVSSKAARDFRRHDQSISSITSPYRPPFDLALKFVRDAERTCGMACGT